jgi:transcriptional regulator of aromatic amino acid metabolism
MEHIPLTWTTKTVKLGELKPLKNNPRKITPLKQEQLKASVDKLGVFRSPIVDHNNTILGGNQLYNDLLARGALTDVIEVKTPNRALTKEERERVILEDNLHKGEFDLDELTASFNSDLLKELEFFIPSGITDGDEPEIDEVDLGKKLDTYLNNTIKQVVLYFEHGVYVNLLQRMEKASEELGVDNNSDLFLKLMERYENSRS